ncbi:uncharacterized protein TNCV_1997461 [Trichonephila clavipes]|uniref:Uncharacterized protein n=1 Tax=Trichonephila clavipes TaxID=2585209 RepID=A0A8X6RQK0_TRICX|nr:uncharacterized protein TNCV_1997461 [Trichonephila clavipes]
MFKESRESVEDEPRAGRPSTSRTAENEQRVRHLLNTNRRISVRMIAEQLGMDKMFVHKIIKRCCPLGICARKTDSQWCLLRGSVKKIEATGQPSETRNFRHLRPENPPQLEAPPRQYAISHLLRGYRALDKKWHLNNSTASLQPRPCPSRLFPLPKVKTALKRHHHETLDVVKRACTYALKDVSVGDFQGAYEAWKRRLQKCVHAQ